MKLTFGASTDLGGKKENQDDFLISTLSYCQIFAVFDGHGNSGKHAAAFVKTRIEQEFSKASDLFTATESRVKDIFLKIDAELKQNEAIDTYLSGTTASICLISNHKLITIQLGDGRILLGRKEGATLTPVQITSEHTCESERERLSKGSGTLAPLFEGDKPYGPLRLFKGSLPYPGIVVSRAFGDDVAKKLGVSAEPDISIRELTTVDHVLVIGCDGVWDALDNKQVLECIRGAQSAQEASDLITQVSKRGLLSKQLEDNITNITILFE